MYRLRPTRPSELKSTERGTLETTLGTLLPQVRLLKETVPGTKAKQVMLVIMSDENLHTGLTSYRIKIGKFFIRSFESFVI